MSSDITEADMCCVCTRGTFLRRVIVCPDCDPARLRAALLRIINYDGDNSLYSVNEHEWHIARDALGLPNARSSM